MSLPARLFRPKRGRLRVENRPQVGLGQYADSGTIARKRFAGGVPEEKIARHRPSRARAGSDD